MLHRTCCKPFFSRPGRQFLSFIHLFYFIALYFIYYYYYYCYFRVRIAPFCTLEETAGTYYLFMRWVGDTVHGNG